METQDMNVREKHEAKMGAGENTSDKPVFSPAVDIWETADGLALSADMPGVAGDSLALDLSEGTLTISGKVAPAPGDRKMILQEYGEGNFYRQFALADSIDQSRITATLKDGVLKLSLPRLAPAQPRRIEISAE